MNIRSAAVTLCVLVVLAGCDHPTTAPLERREGAPDATPHLDAAPFVGSRVVASGGKSTCALRGDGTASCWGETSYDATAARSGSFAALGAGFFHYCGLRPDQTIDCWGYGSDNRTLAPAGQFVQLAVGQEHNCALRTDLTAVCWGFLGDGRGSPPSGTYKVLTSGWYHGCGIRPDDTLACWGQNGSGQSTAPAGTFRTVSGGGTHTCAIRTDGTLACFGAIAAPPSGTFVQVSAGSGGHACAIRSDGSLSCWGDNSYGQASPPAGQFVQVSAGWQHTCAVRADQRILCWGLNTNGSTTVPSEFVNRVPIANAGGGYAVLVHQPAFLSGAASTDPDGDALTYAWDTDGDGVTDATTADVSRAFDAPGAYTVSLRVTDPSGASSAASATVTVRAPDLAAGLPNTCGHQITGIAWDGTYYYVAEGQFALFQCITRYDASGGYVDHKVFAIDMRGLHFVPATGKLVTRHYNGGFYAVDYAAGTHVLLTNYQPAPEQVQAAADPNGTSFWFVNESAAEEHRLTDNGITRSLPVNTNNAAVIGVSNKWIFTVLGTTVNVYSKASGSSFGTQTLPSTLGCYTGWGFGASATGDRLMYASDCATAKVVMTGLMENTPPVARAGGPYSVLVNQPVFVDGSTSSDADGDALTYAWDFDGDGTSDANTASASHAFAAVGTYTVTLVVRDASGASGTSTATVTVRAPDLAAGLPNTCGHQITGIAFDGTYYYVAEGQFALFQCITRYNGSGGYVDHKVFAIDMRGLHFVPATGKLVTRHYNGGFYAIDYAAGTQTVLTSYAPAPEQVQAAADPNGSSFWFVNGTAAEEHRLADNGLVRTVPVATTNAAVIAVSNVWIFTVQGTTVNVYDKLSGAGRGSFTLPSGLGCYTQWGLGASASGDRVLWASSCVAAKRFLTGLTEPGATSAGNGVSVQPVVVETGVTAPIDMTFSTVTSSGITSVEVRAFDGSAPPPPSGFRLGTPDTFFDISTTASFTGAVQVCINYGSVSYGNESELRLLHRRSDGVWEDATTSLDTNAKVICGSVTSLSPFAVAEANRAPIVTRIALPAAPVPQGQAVMIGATFTDANPRDVHTALISWDDGSGTSTGSVTEAGGTGDLTAQRLFAAAGVYTVGVSVSDGLLTGSRSSALDAPSYVVVYDASAGFVTGGGWITSPAGACRTSLCVANGVGSGKATFGFVSRYQKGAHIPTGNAEFQFSGGGLNFSSTSYEWLVVAGRKAQFKGVGMINGDGDYGFLITAIDGQLSGPGESDRFRIKIWARATGEVVYDNQLGASEDSSAATILGGGSIIIHP